MYVLLRQQVRIIARLDYNTYFCVMQVAISHILQVLFYTGSLMQLSALAAIRALPEPTLLLERQSARQSMLVPIIFL